MIVFYEDSRNFVIVLIISVWVFSQAEQLMAKQAAADRAHWLPAANVLQEDQEDGLGTGELLQQQQQQMHTIAYVSFDFFSFFVLLVGVYLISSPKREKRHS